MRKVKRALQHVKFVHKSISVVCSYLRETVVSVGGRRAPATGSFVRQRTCGLYEKGRRQDFLTTKGEHRGGNARTILTPNPESCCRSVTKGLQVPPLHPLTFFQSSLRQPLQVPSKKESYTTQLYTNSREIHFSENIICRIDCVAQHLLKKFCSWTSSVLLWVGMVSRK